MHKAASPDVNHPVIQYYAPRRPRKSNPPYDRQATTEEEQQIYGDLSFGHERLNSLRDLDSIYKGVRQWAVAMSPDSKRPFASGTETSNAGLLLSSGSTENNHYFLNFTAGA